MDLMLGLELLLFVVLLMLSGFFSSSETAIFSLKSIQREQMQRNNHPRIGLINRLLSEPRRLIVTILIGNELVNVSASVLSAVIVIQFYGADNKFLNLFVMIPILLLVGEITPKSLAIRNNAAFAAWQAPWIDRFAMLIKPVRIVILKISEFIITSIIGSDRSGGNIITEDMVRTLTNNAADKGALDSHEAALIQQIFDFGNMRVEKVITPRSEISYLKDSSTLHDALIDIREHRHSKVPVYHRNRDDIVGVLYARDLLGKDLRDNRHKLSSKPELLREPYFVTQSKPVTDLFSSFRERKLSIAIVVDEYGGVIGLVTMEDLLETIFGDIHSPSDQSDEQTSAIKEVSAGSYSIDGSIEIDEFNQRFKLNLPTLNADTIGGMLLHKHGELPPVGTTISVLDVDFTIVELEENRIAEILVCFGSGDETTTDQVEAKTSEVGSQDEIATEQVEQETDKTKLKDEDATDQIEVEVGETKAQESN